MNCLIVDIPIRKWWERLLKLPPGHINKNISLICLWKKTPTTIIIIIIIRYMLTDTGCIVVIQPGAHYATFPRQAHQTPFEKTVILTQSTQTSKIAFLISQWAFSVGICGLGL